MSKKNEGAAAPERKTISRPATPGAVFDPASIKKLKQLVFPTLKVEPGIPFYINIREPMFIGRELDNAEKGEDGKAKRGPATILRVHCFHGGEDNHPLNGKEVQIVANKLLVGTLNENYPDAAYVGKSFMVTKSDKAKKGKNGDYYPFEVDEIDAEAPPLL